MLTEREFTALEVTGLIGVGTTDNPHRTLTVYFERLPDGQLREIAKRDPWDEAQRARALANQERT